MVECSTDKDCELRKICVWNATWQQPEWNLGLPSARCECYQTHGWAGVNCSNMSQAPYGFQFALRSGLVLIFLGLLFALCRGVVRFVLYKEVAARYKFRGLQLTTGVLFITILLELISIVFTIEDSVHPFRYIFINSYKFPSYFFISATSFAVATFTSCLSSFNVSISWIEVGDSLSNTKLKKMTSVLTIYGYFVRFCQFTLIGVDIYFFGFFDILLIVLVSAPFLLILTLTFTFGSWLINAAFKKHILTEGLNVSVDVKQSVEHMAQLIRKTSRLMCISIFLIFIGGLLVEIPYVSPNPYANKRIDSAIGGWQRTSSWGMTFIMYSLAFSDFALLRFILAMLDKAPNRQQIRTQNSRKVENGVDQDIDSPSVISVVTPNEGVSVVHSLAEAGIEAIGDGVTATTTHVVTPATARGNRGRQEAATAASEFTTVTDVMTINQAAPQRQLLITGQRWRDDPKAAWTPEVQADGVIIYKNQVTGKHAFEPQSESEN